jgi:hypothetical protein
MFGQQETRVRLAAAAVALLLGGALPLRAEAPSVARAEVLWAGLYQAVVVGRITQPGTASGITNELAGTRKIKQTTTVEGRLGISFGMEYLLVGSPAGADVPITIVVTLPKEGLHNPANPEPTYREQWRPAPKTIGGANIVGYTFEHTWEIVPGLWTFEVWWEEHKLAEQSFCVVTERPPEGDKTEPCKSVPTT